MNSIAIYNLVRALTRPYIGAHIVYGGNDITIWKVEVIEYMGQNIEPGKVLASDGETIIVKTYDGAIKILEHEFEILPNIGEYL
jgi:methionyl-tRNA formyltransferase